MKKVSRVTTLTNINQWKIRLGECKKRFKKKKKKKSFDSKWPIQRNSEVLKRSVCLNWRLITFIAKDEVFKELAALVSSLFGHEGEKTCYDLPVWLFPPHHMEAVY